jgi:uncharacterized protein (DUF1778 family)
MAMRKNFENNDWANANFRVKPNHYELIHRAAAHHGITAAEYMRRLTIIHAAADLGLEKPDMSPYGADEVTLAARRLGLNVQEFKELAIAEHARRVLGYQSDAVERVSADLGAAVGLPVNPHESGQFKAVRPKKTG